MLVPNIVPIVHKIADTIELASDKSEFETWGRIFLANL